MDRIARVAYFPDTYKEIDGVANTSRQFEAFAGKRGYPFLIVCAGTENRAVQEGTVTRLMFRRSRFGFRLDKCHFFDLAFWRYYQRVERAIRKFDPDLIHVTGPSDAGQLGVLLARRLQIPLAISWHTNLHQYAERRASDLLRLLPTRWSKRLGRAIRQRSLSSLFWFYGLGAMLFAPNPELMDMLAKGTGKTVWPMRRGVDTALFNPEKRDREDGDEFVVGYVGRLTVEKNIRLLADIEKSLCGNGGGNVRFSIVGQGAEEEWLRTNMRRGNLTGVLTGNDLARAYANMDVFVFPSRTDTFGNVVLEALASGVPAIVTDNGGPQYLVLENETGFIARSAAEFAGHVRSLMEKPEILATMRRAARAAVVGASWDDIFESLYADYERGLREYARAGKRADGRPHPFIVTSGPA